VFHQRLDLGRHPDICPPEAGRPAGLTDYPDRLLASLNVAIADDDLRAFASKRERGRAAIPEPPPATSATLPSILS